MDLIKIIQEKYQALAIFPYGSSVYQNKKPSDLDFIIVSNMDYFQEKFVIEDKDIEISNYSPQEFIKNLNNHDISFLECLYINHAYKYTDPEFITQLQSFQLNKGTLRESISQKSSNSYVKAKKKLILEDDFDLNVSLKSLWHSLRMVDYGIQLAKEGKISHPQSSNETYDNIVKDYLIMNHDWEKIHDKYKPLQNKALSEFRLLCPKKTNSLKMN